MVVNNQAQKQVQSFVQQHYPDQSQTKQSDVANKILFQIQQVPLEKVIQEVIKAIKFNEISSLKSTSNTSQKLNESQQESNHLIETTKNQLSYPNFHEESKEIQLLAQSNLSQSIENSQLQYQNESSEQQSIQQNAAIQIEETTQHQTNYLFQNQILTSERNLKEHSQDQFFKSQQNSQEEKSSLSSNEEISSYQYSGQQIISLPESLEQKVKQYQPTEQQKDIYQIFENKIISLQKEKETNKSQLDQNPQELEQNAITKEQKSSNDQNDSANQILKYKVYMNEKLAKSQNQKNFINSAHNQQLQGVNMQDAITSKAQQNNTSLPLSIDQEKSNAILSQVQPKAAELNSFLNVQDNSSQQNSQNTSFEIRQSVSQMNLSQMSSSKQNSQLTSKELIFDQEQELNQTTQTIKIFKSIYYEQEQKFISLKIQAKDQEGKVLQMKIKKIHVDEDPYSFDAYISNLVGRLDISNNQLTIQNTSKQPISQEDAIVFKKPISIQNRIFQVTILHCKSGIKVKAQESKQSKILSLKLEQNFANSIYSKEIYQEIQTLINSLSLEKRLGEEVLIIERK